MWLSKKAYQALVTRLSDIEAGQDVLLQSHEATEKKVSLIDEYLAGALGPHGVLGKKLDVVSGQLVRIEKQAKESFEDLSGQNANLLTRVMLLKCKRLPRKKGKS